LFASIVGLGLVFVPHVGVMVNGARRWLFGFQPSEFTKLALVLYLASALAAKGERVRSFVQGLLPLCFVCASLVVLVILEPDLGTASLLALTAAAMLFAAGARLAHLAAIALVMLPALVAYVDVSDYRRNRILAFLDPWKDQQNAGFHIVQSLLALGSGGPIGLGLGFSRQKFAYLPEQYTDFIFAILGEELGLIGTAAVVGLFVVFAYRAVKIALGAPDRFGFFLAIGCMSTIVIQAFVNVGVVTSSWPVTGVPLPFISFGGSSLVVSLIAAALLVNIGRHRRTAT
jgi:cell division protein FtsW